MKLLVHFTFFLLLGEIGALKLLQKVSKFVPKYLTERLKRELKKKNSAGGKIVAINEDLGMTSRLFQGDIRVKPEDKSIISKRNAMRNRVYVWRTKRIPYVFDADIVKAGTANILQAIKITAERTCIKWEEKTESDTNYVKFVKKDG